MSLIVQLSVIPKVFTRYMEQGRTKHQVGVFEWLISIVMGAVVFFVAIEAEQHPLAMVAAVLAVLALFGLLWRLLKVPLVVRQPWRR